MKKATTFFALLGAVLTIVMVVHAVRWGNVQMERTRQECIRWTMSWADRR